MPLGIPNGGGCCWANALTQCLEACGAGVGLGYEALRDAGCPLGRGPQDPHEALLLAIDAAGDGPLRALVGARAFASRCTACGVSERRLEDTVVPTIWRGGVVSRAACCGDAESARAPCAEAGCGGTVVARVAPQRPPRLAACHVPEPRKASWTAAPVAAAVLRRGGHYVAAVRDGEGGWWVVDDLIVRAVEDSRALALIRSQGYIVFFR